MKTNYLPQLQRSGDTIKDSYNHLPIEENRQSPRDMINELLAAKASLESTLASKDAEIAELKPKLENYRNISRAAFDYCVEHSVGKPCEPTWNALFNHLNTLNARIKELEGELEKCNDDYQREMKANG